MKKSQKNSKQKINIVNIVHRGVKYFKNVFSILKKGKQILTFILVIFISWQLLVAIIINTGAKFIPSTNSYTYSEGIYPVNPPIFYTRANYDGIYYLDIARKDYGVYQQAFFPVYPKLIKYLSKLIGGRELMAGLFISWISFFVALVIFYKLIMLDFQKKIAKRAMLYLLIFPTAFFFSAVYSESLFLLLILGSFYFARIKKWWFAGILGAIASGTRLVGIFLFPALLVEYYSQKQDDQSGWDLKKIIPILFVPLGLLLYMRYLSINYQDPFMFFTVQPAFGVGRGADKMILLYQVYWRYFKMILTTRIDPLYFTVWLELLSASLFLVLLIKGVLKKIRLSYMVFAILAFITPTLTGTFLSIPRFVLILFPGFMVLALIENRLFRIIFTIICFISLFIATAMFTRGYFVS